MNRIKKYVSIGILIQCVKYYSNVWYFFLAVHEKDKNYEATRLHFENLRKRYGNPIIILNLIKVSTLL